jgi:hypothetical protein
MDKTIYMPLIEEGTDCWRPVRAVHIGADLFEVIKKIPASEVWAFAPFSRVRCPDKIFADGNVGLAIFAYAIESHPYYRLLKESTGRLSVSYWLTAKARWLESVMSMRSMKILFATQCR